MNLDSLLPSLRLRVALSTKYTFKTRCLAIVRKLPDGACLLARGLRQPILSDLWFDTAVGAEAAAVETLTASSALTAELMPWLKALPSITFLLRGNLPSWRILLRQSSWGIPARNVFVGPIASSGAQCSCLNSGDTADKCQSATAETAIRNWLLRRKLVAEQWLYHS